MNIAPLFPQARGNLLSLRDVAAELRELGASSQGHAVDILHTACINVGVRCSRCASREASVLRGGRLRCLSCKQPYSLIAGRWLARHQLSPRSWLMMLKAFEYGFDVRSAGTWTDLPSATSYRVMETIRFALDAGTQAEAVTSAECHEFVSSWLRRYRGVAPRLRSIYIREAELRFAWRGRPLFDMLLRCVARYESGKELSVSALYNRAKGDA